MFLDGKKGALLDEMRSEMERAATELRFEKAARIRDELKALSTQGFDIFLNLIDGYFEWEVPSIEPIEVLGLKNSSAAM